MDAPKSKHITWSDALITRADREAKHGHKPAVLWFTGLSSSGKSTLARLVERELFQRGCRTYILDGDNIRHGLNRDLGFSPEDREENIRRIGEVAKLLVDAGLIALTAFISPYRRDRDRNRDLLDAGEFIEIYCRCALGECEKRDPKGLYKKARAGQIPEFTGISAPYEEPLSAELVIDTDQAGVEACVARILAYLEQKGVVPAR